MGELVFTTLTKEGLPMVRFRTRDLTRLLPGTARTMRRIEKITGRSDDMIILRGVNVFPSQIEEQVLKTPELAPHFQIELHRKDRMDAMTVLVETTASDSDGGAPDTIAQNLTVKIKEAVGVSTQVVVGEPGTVARSQGKAQRVVDKRPKE